MKYCFEMEMERQRCEYEDLHSLSRDISESLAEYIQCVSFTLLPLNSFSIKKTKP
jgi:hypothetical protein